VAEVLKLAEFPEWHRMPEVDIKAGGIDAVFDAKRTSGQQLSPEVIAGFDLSRSPHDDVELFVNGKEIRHGK
jgi:hypothetical protein